MNLSTSERAWCLGILKQFKIDGVPADEKITEGQLEIFAALVLGQTNRVNILTSTQYGKSLIVALACIYLSCCEGELISILAPTDEKAKIIMRYYLSHIGDHVEFYQQLEKDTKIDRLAMETTKDRLILRNKGGIFIISVQAGNTKKGFEAAMGEGSKFVILDEAALVPNEIEATVFRMIAGKGPDATYVKIGNPFFRNHFYESSHDPNYTQIFIDYHQAIKENRYTQQFIDEAINKPLFSILYECIFPPEDQMTNDGYIQLLTSGDLENAIIDDIIPVGNRVLLVDPAAGGDESSIVLASEISRHVLFSAKLNDTMVLVGLAVKFWQQYEPDEGRVDGTGIGKPILHRLQELGRDKRNPMTWDGVEFGGNSDDEKFYDNKTELYWQEAEFIRNGGKLVKHPRWSEWQNIRYKIDSSGTIRLESKDDLRKRGIRSPDTLDASVMSQSVDWKRLKKTVLQRKFGKPVFKDNIRDLWKK
jgi:hypothetical protein